jgi:hypothetical protein
MVTRELTCFFTAIFAFVLLLCSTTEQIPKKRYKGIDRTLNLLNSSSEEHPNSIEILFYGQSIIGGMKTNILVDSLKQRFPFANISFKHKPIGGFTIPDLTRTVAHDVYQENPDLIIFHAYGGIKDGLYDLLVKNIRERMSSDILLLDHHYVWNMPASKLEFINKSHDFDSKAIEEIAKKYDCGFVNVREQWKTYLEINQIGPNELMGNSIDPNVHPNDKGNELLRNIVLSKFPKSKVPSTFNVYADSLRKITPLKKENAHFKKKQHPGTVLELFVDNKNTNKAVIEVLIDARKPSEFKSSYHIERPSKGYKNWMPGISRVSFGKTFPREEDWTISLFDIDRENKKFKFKLEGSLTGFDGQGNNEDLFISDSNRISLDGNDFNVFRIETISKSQTPENFQINFRINQIARDTLTVYPEKNKYLIFRTQDSLQKPIQLEVNVIKGEVRFKHLMMSRPYLKN